MNSLSWFLYLTSVIDAARGAALGALAFGGIATAMWCFGHYVTDELSKPPRWPFVGLVCAVALLVLTPDRNTLYAIAASEMGERVLKTDVATDAQKALQQWIKRQIEPDKKS